MFGCIVGKVKEMSQIGSGQTVSRASEGRSTGPARRDSPFPSLERLRPRPLALAKPPPFPGHGALGSARPSSPAPPTRRGTGPARQPRPRQAPPPAAAPGSAHLLWAAAGGRRPAAGGGAVGAALRSGREIRRGVTGKLVRVPRVSLCGSLGSASRCPVSFPPFGLRSPPGPSLCPRPPWSSRRHLRGNESGSGKEGSGAGGRGAGVARPGPAATLSLPAGP